MFFKDAAADYLRHLEHERKVAKSTIYNYRTWLNNFQRWLGEKGYPEPPTLEQFTTVILRRYQQELSEVRHLRPRTIRAAFHPLRGLGEFLVANGIVERSPAHDLAMPRKDAAQRVVVTDADLQSLLEATGRVRDPAQAAFERALLSVLIYTGVRAGELAAIRVSHLDLSAKTLLVPCGKGSKSRTLYLTDECAAALKAWVKVRPECEHDWLWPCDVARRKSIETLRRDLEDVKARAGLAHAVWIKPHSMRHALATRLMKNGADLRAIQAALGHSDAQTTFNYLHHSEQPALEMQAKASFMQPSQQPGSAVGSQPPTRAEVIRKMRRRRSTAATATTV
jgi:integrase/recombinase XerD